MKIETNINNIGKNSRPVWSGHCRVEENKITDKIILIRINKFTLRVNNITY